MTRKEEIKQNATDISNTWLPQDYQQVAYDAAIKMAKWVDQHPRKGLWDAEKVIDYIYHHAHVRTFGDIVIDDMSMTEFIETMKKAMED